MLQDIGERPTVKTTILNARKVTNYIYNHGWILNMMRKECGGDIVWPAVMQFATNFIALDNMYKHKQGLKKLFTFEEWADSDFSRKAEGKSIEDGWWW